MFNQYPYTNFHELNLDWILKQMEEFRNRLSAAETRIAALENLTTLHTSEIAFLKSEAVRIEKKHDEEYAALERRVKALEDIAGGVVYSTGATSYSNTEMTEVAAPDTESTSMEIFDL